MIRTFASRCGEVRPPLTSAIHKSNSFRNFLAALFLLATCVPSAFGVSLRHRSESSDVVNQFEFSAPEADVLEAVRQVVKDQIIHGTYVYEKEKTLRGARPASSSTAFHDEVPGQVFYKVANQVIDPRFFHGNGQGTLTVRYVVTPSGEGASVRIDAVFVEDAHHRVDKSDGVVESAEYDAIRAQLDEIQQARLHPEAQTAGSGLRPVSPPPANATQPPATASSQASAAPQFATNTNAVPQETTLSETALRDLEQQVGELRKQVEGQIKDNGTILRSAPIARSATVDTLPASSAVVILVITPKWFGVETPDGHRGWVRRSELEPRH